MAILYGNNRGDRTSYLNQMDKKWVDLIQRNRSESTYTDAVVIAAVDTKSIDRFGRWPWDRGHIASLVEALNEHYQVATIGFDIVFSEGNNQALNISKQYLQQLEASGVQKIPEGQQALWQLERFSQELDGDLKLAEQVQGWPNVVLGYVLLSNSLELQHLTQEEIDSERKRLRPHAISVVKNMDLLKKSGVPDEKYPEMTTPKIAGDAAMGFFNVNIDADGVVRRIHALRKVGERYYPALSLKMIANAFQERIQVVANKTGVESIKVGDMELAPDPEGAFLLNYKGPQKTFAHYSIADIIDHKVPLEKLEGKLILVGITEVGILDLRTTPVSEAYAGVEVHANAIDNFLTDSYFRVDPVNELVTFALIIIGGLLLALVLPRVKLPVAIVIFLILLGGYTSFHQYAVNTLLAWPSYIYVTLTLVVVFFGVTQYMFFVSDRDKRFIKDAFQQYLAPSVIQDILKNPDGLQLGGEERVMTALFSDIQGFSTISEKLTPGELVALLNDYLSEMTDIIMEHGGTVDKFEGDAIIAFFGAPLHYEDHATRAARVCLDMEAKLQESRGRWREQWGIEVFHRIGINTGPMIVGNMGSKNRFDYTMMGNAVNLAARLEGINKVYGTALMMSEATRQSCEGSMELRELDNIRVIGIHQPVQIYEILGRKGDVDAQVLEGCRIFEEGLEAYRKQDWDQAMKLFNEANDTRPEDPPSKIFIERCQHYKANPLNEEWEGVYQATSK